MAMLLLKNDLSRHAHEVKPLDLIILEIKENIEALSQELHYWHDRVDWLILYENRPDELSDIIFKLHDISHSLSYKKQLWADLLKKLDHDLTPQPSTALETLRANAEHLRNQLIWKYARQEKRH